MTDKATWLFPVPIFIFKSFAWNPHFHCLWSYIFPIWLTRYQSNSKSGLFVNHMDIYKHQETGWKLKTARQHIQNYLSLFECFRCRCLSLLGEAFVRVYWLTSFSEQITKMFSKLNNSRWYRRSCYWDFKCFVWTKCFISFIFVCWNLDNICVHSIPW